MDNAGWQRIAVVGVTGSGKTTLARTLAQRFDVPHIEFDSLQWESGWRAARPAVFRERVAQAVSATAWITDGNYSSVRDLVWGQATALIWLDYAWPVIAGFRLALGAPHFSTHRYQRRIVEWQP